MKNLPGTTFYFAAADQRGSDGEAPKLTPKQRAFKAFERALDKDAKSQERAEVARRKATGETFATWMEGADTDLVVVSGHQREPAVSRLQGPLNLLIDSTGTRSEGEGEWIACKHGGSKRRVWCKIRTGRDAGILDVRAVEPTSSNIGDAPMLTELLNQIPPGQDISSFTADEAYGTRRCHHAIAARGTHAVMPPAKNAKPWKPTSAAATARNEAINAQRYLGRTLWRRWSGDHCRSRVETKMRCMKPLGQSLMARDFERQVTGIQVRVAVLNDYTALGIPVTELAG